jgi:hypothetical protein
MEYAPTYDKYSSIPMPIAMKDLALCTVLNEAQRYFNAGHGVGTKSTKKIC